MIGRLGKSYIIRHCTEEMRKQAEDRIFRVYVTDALKAIADNTSFIPKEGASLKLRYIEMLDGIKPERKPQETAEQIKTRISAGINALANKEAINDDGDNKKGTA